MGFKCGIVGLPNIGKSTLFNAITRTVKAEAANYPFCTIDPNSAVINIKDFRLQNLASIAGSAELIPNTLEIVDIAGLVKGASTGEGLGNKFLSNIREVDAIIHLVRAFEDPDITHVEGHINPLRDIDIINTELIFSDLESVTFRIEKNSKKLKQGEKEVVLMDSILRKSKLVLEKGLLARSVLPDLSNDDEVKIFKTLNLLTSKPMIYVSNVSESDIKSGNGMSRSVDEFAKSVGSSSATISVKIEADISQISDESETLSYLEMFDLKESGLNGVVRSGFEILDLITYFTIGPKEAHAWTVKKNTTAPKAAGVIHTDFESGFIRAEVISYDDYIKHGGEQGCKDSGKMRLEGKEYIVQDGDIMHFRFAN